jgi:hypothetical protein
MRRLPNRLSQSSGIVYRHRRAPDRWGPSSFCYCISALYTELASLLVGYLPTARRLCGRAGYGGNHAAALHHDRGWTRRVVRCSCSDPRADTRFGLLLLSSSLLPPPLLSPPVLSSPLLRLPALLSPQVLPSPVLSPPVLLLISPTGLGRRDYSQRAVLGGSFLLLRFGTPAYTR